MVKRSAPGMSTNVRREICRGARTASVRACARRVHRSMLVSGMQEVRAGLHRPVRRGSLRAADSRKERMRQAHAGMHK